MNTWRVSIQIFPMEKCVVAWSAHNSYSCTYFMHSWQHYTGCGNTGCRKDYFFQKNPRNTVMAFWVMRLASCRPNQWRLVMLLQTDEALDTISTNWVLWQLGHLQAMPFWSRHSPTPHKLRALSNICRHASQSPIDNYETWSGWLCWYLASNLGSRWTNWARLPETVHQVYFCPTSAPHWEIGYICRLFLNPQMDHFRINPWIFLCA